MLIQRIRDEAHRFAITYHRRLRISEKFDTDLRKIKGVGPRRERVLLERFGGIENIRGLTKGRLEEAGIDKRTARAIVRYFKNNRPA